MSDVQEQISQGLHHLQLGELAAAETVCARILSNHPSNAEALNLRAMIAYQRGEFAIAIDFYKKAIAACPDGAGYHNNLGVSLRSMRRISEAANAYRRAAALNPASAQIQFNLGDTLTELGEIDAAVSALREAVRLRPEEAAFHYALGVALVAGQKQEEAVEAYRKAVQLKPELIDAWMNLGNVLHGLGRVDAALEAHRQAVALQPLYSGSHNNLGLVLYTSGDLQGSMTEFRRAISLRADFASAWSNLGNVLRDVGNLEEAIAAYRRAIALQVDHPDARQNLSLALLQAGDYANGFLEYEWRWKVAGSPPRRFKQPRWVGEDPSGKTIFIYQEQGYGDVIQFARYVKLLANRGAKVIFGCRPELSRLLAGCAGVAEILTAGQITPPFDLHCPLMSLPLFCRTTTLASVPGEVPYIRVSEEIARPWKESVPRDGRRKVGLCWAGNPENRNDKLRSISLKRFLPWGQVNGIEFHSLQVGPAAAEAGQDSTLKVIDHSAHLRDFADTAALIDQLDLVISVDTSVAHLAGALGKPVWIMVPKEPDWRWLLERTDSPWYPTARLFRRTEEWDAVIQTVGQELGRWVKGK